MHTTIANETAKGPYSTVVQAGDFVFLSGQGGIGVDGRKVTGGIVAETKRTLDNIKDLLAEAGLEMENLVSITCYLTDITEWTIMNEAWTEALSSSVRPTRTAVEVANLPFGLCIEMTAVAYRPAARAEN
jgi:2-iminobutanoate/2-iminopropanoate deaminase